MGFYFKVISWGFCNSNLSIFGSADIILFQIAVEICENTRQQIVCFGGTTIHITEAIYGRKRKGNKCGLNPIFYCKARDSKLSKVRNLCEGKVFCSVHVTDDNFGNPCLGSEEYMHIKYDCVGMCCFTFR